MKISMPVVKRVCGFIAGAGASTVVSNVVRATAPGNASMLNKILTGVGELILGAMVSESARQYTESLFEPTKETK